MEPQGLGLRGEAGGILLPPGGDRPGKGSHKMRGVHRAKSSHKHEAWHSTFCLLRNQDSDQSPPPSVSTLLGAAGQLGESGGVGGTSIGNAVCFPAHAKSSWLSGFGVTQT